VNNAEKEGFLLPEDNKLFIHSHDAIELLDQMFEP
jgi:hypothetical protein